MPTLLELTGTPYPKTFNEQTLKPLRGRSLAPIFTGQPRPPRPRLFFDWGNQHHALRMGKWKLVAIDRGPWELYDMEADRTELNDLSSRETARTAEMRELWEDWAREVGIGQRRKKK
jgi:arylsulfatase